MFKNTVLRKIFGPKRDEVGSEWRRLHNEELYDLYSSPNIIRVIKSRRRKSAGQVAHNGDGRVIYRVFWGGLMERDGLEGLDVDERTILKWIFKNGDGR